MHQLLIKYTSKFLLSDLVAADIIMFIRKEANQTEITVIPVIFKIFLFLPQDFQLIGGSQELYCLWQGTHYFLPALVLIISWRIWAKFIITMPTGEFSPLTHERCLHSFHCSCKHKSKNRPKYTETFAPGASCHTNEINGKSTTNFKQM